MSLLIYPHMGNSTEIRRVSVYVDYPADPLVTFVAERRPGLEMLLIADSDADPLDDRRVTLGYFSRVWGRNPDSFAQGHTPAGSEEILFVLRRNEIRHIYTEYWDGGGEFWA